VQLRQKAEELEALGMQIAVIAPDQPESLKTLHKALRLPYPLLGDAEQAVYHQYGLLVKGQLVGGDFIADAEGILRYAYRGATADDRPEIEDLIAAAQKIARGDD
jgi:peroxiredoxin